jgi:hypothetical protein
MQPAQGCWLGGDIEACSGEAEIVTFARAEHHPMLSQLHRLRIAIRCEMTHGQHAHGKLLNAIMSDSPRISMAIVWFTVESFDND